MERLAVLGEGPAGVLLRTATSEDVPAVVGLLAADQRGATRDGVRDEADLAAYTAAFRSIDADPAHPSGRQLDQEVFEVAPYLEGRPQRLLVIERGLYAERLDLRGQPGY